MSLLFLLQWLRHFVVHGALHRARHHAGHHAFELGFNRASIHVIFVGEQRIEALTRHLLWFAVMLASLADLRLVHTAAMKEVSISWTGLQRGHRYSCIAQLI